MMKKLQDQWKEQSMSTRTLSLDELRQHDAELTRVVRHRNIREFLAGGIAVAFLLAMSAITLAQAQLAPDFVMGGGFAILAGGTVFAGWHLFRNSRPVEGDLATTGSEHLRRRLERERKLLSSAWLWYLGPMVPGFVVIYLGSWLSATQSKLFPLLFGGLTLVFLIGVALLNRHVAMKIKRQIESLED